MLTVRPAGIVGLNISILFCNDVLTVPIDGVIVIAIEPTGAHSNGMDANEFTMRSLK